jgi:hypothetical protein
MENGMRQMRAAGNGHWAANSLIYRLPSHTSASSDQFRLNRTKSGLKKNKKIWNQHPRPIMSFDFPSPMGD